MDLDFNEKFGFSIHVGMRKSRMEELLKNASPDQDNPSGNYVYGHYDKNGNLFYVGRGTNRRAWSKNRHPLWHRYVENHLDGVYSVRIMVDGLTPENAEELEAGLIAEHGDTLVNWINFGRETDYDVLDKFHELRNANRKFIKETKAIEKTDIELAIKNYKIAIEKIAEYAYLKYEKGLVGRLLEEEKSELGRRGEIEALDRITLCLIKVGRSYEAAEYTNAYFQHYKGDERLKSSDRIKKRVRKALEKAKNSRDK